MEFQSIASLEVHNWTKHPNQQARISKGYQLANIFKINNVTDIYSKGFNITIPEDNHFADQNIGKWRSGAHEQFVFLKPLPKGDHTINYNVGVAGTGPNDHSSEISYDLKVK